MIYDGTEMNILICDDIHEEALKLEKAIKAAGFEGDCSIFNRGRDVIAFIQEGAKIDVCFLDILMPDMKGTELARKIRAAQYKGEIVFLTTTNEYAAESYEVKAHSYLIKPPNAYAVSKVLNDITEAQRARDTAGIPITTRNMTRFLCFYEISHVEVKEKTVYFRLVDGTEIAVYSRLNDFLPQLMADGRFAQCHRSYVVNMDYISYIQGREVFLRCGRKAPISKHYSEFDKQYLNWIFGSRSVNKTMGGL